MRHISIVNDAQYDMFKQRYAPKSMLEPLEKLRAADSIHLPPSYRVVLEKVKRTNYVTTIWITAHLPNPTNDLDPEECGWTLQDGLDMAQFEGQQMPTNLKLNAREIKELASKDDNDSMEAYDSESDESEYKDLFN